MTLAGVISALNDGPAADPMNGAAAMPRWFASHELRTPIQAIRGGVELVLEDGGKGLSALQLEAMSLIADAAAALERCVGCLAELADLAECPPPPLDSLALDAFLAAPEIARHVSVDRDLLAVAAVKVELAPGPAGRALAELARPQAGSEQAGRLSLDLEEVGADQVNIAVELAPVSSGDGAVSRRLAVMLLRHSGISFEQRADGRARLTLRRACRTPI